MNLKLTASIVAYRNDPTVLGSAVKSFAGNTLNGELIILDNSPTNDLQKLAIDAGIHYKFNNANLGFGKAHNAFMRTIMNTSKYHLVLNPDVTFEAGTLETLYEFMESNLDVGLIMPKVLDTDHRLQYLCKRLPTPLDLIARRFGGTLLQNSHKQKQFYYEMRDKDYNTVFEVPYLSGCFMFLRVDALKKVGLFDERFFMYMEDIDLSRRMFKSFKNIYYPHAQIIHGHARDSYKTDALLKVHALSAIKYFNKWGWYFDKERSHINSMV
jgi:GT2 family glycosyltransferase